VLFPVNISIFFFIVVFRLQENLAYIIHILDRSLTFTGRTYLWESAMEMIKKAPILGYGVTEQGVLYNVFENVGWGLSAHNMYLEILLRGGAVALITYILIIVIAGKILTTYKKHPVAELFSTGIFTLLIGALMDSQFYKDVSVFSIIVLAYYVDRIIEDFEYCGLKPEKKNIILTN